MGKVRGTMKFSLLWVLLVASTPTMYARNLHEHHPKPSHLSISLSPIILQHLLPFIPIFLTPHTLHTHFPYTTYPPCPSSNPLLSLNLHTYPLNSFPRYPSRSFSIYSLAYSLSHFFPRRMHGHAWSRVTVLPINSVIMSSSNVVTTFLRWVLPSTGRTTPMEVFPLPLCHRRRSLRAGFHGL